MNTKDSRKFLVTLLETELECRYDDPEFCFENNESEIRVLEAVLFLFGETSVIEKWGKV